MIARFLFVLALVIAADAALIVYFVTQPSSAAALPVVVIAATGMVPLIAMLAFHMLWRPIFLAYPLQPKGLDAVSRRFQSFGVSIVNMGFSIHATTDDEHLHLEPLWVWQVLGASPASIPWTELSPEPRSLLAREGCAVRLNGNLIVGPRWCFERVFASA